jgi:Beta-ketoacyl synthase, N-terminal domain
MRASILSTGLFSSDKVERLLADPKFRRATRNMALAYLTISDLCETLPSGWLESHADRLAFVVGTSHGELEPTVQFLRGLGSSGIARPFVFQNSLHNATLGFLSQIFGFRGPAFTVSHHYFSGEDALEIAIDLLSDVSSPYALVVGIDGLISGTERAFQSTYPPGTELREGAGAVLLGPLDETRLTPLAWLGDCRRERTSLSPSTSPHYDANAVEALARAVREGAPSPLELVKPNRYLSRFEWKREKQC